MKLKEIKKLIKKPYVEYDFIAIMYKAIDWKHYENAHYIINQGCEHLVDLPINPWGGGKTVNEKQIDNMLRYGLKLCDFVEVVEEVNETFNETELQIKFVLKIKAGEQ